MRKYKHITLVCGHYGSGKTNVAINMAYELSRSGAVTAIADLDIVNPYFRTSDCETELKSKGIRVIRSQYAGTNLDAPAMPADMYAITEEGNMKTIVDVGGDDRGALALGRLTPAILDEGDYDMLLVVNRYRPLTPDAASTVDVMREIEAACGIPFTGIVNNSNLGRETTADTVRSSIPYAIEVSELSGLPVIMTSVEKNIAAQLKIDVPDIFPLQLLEYNL